MSEEEKVSSLITYLYETMNGELALDYANLDSENIEILLDYIEKLENIIKEVREYIEKNTEEKKSWLNGMPDYTVFKGDAKELLEILGGENNDK